MKAPHPIRIAGSDVVQAAAGAQQGASAPQSANLLTLYRRSVALPDNVRELLDWLIDEELKRWHGQR